MNNNDFVLLEYVWIDGFRPWGLRSKVRVLPKNLFLESTGDDTPPHVVVSIDRVPSWSFDGSSTGQADGIDSDCLLRPVRIVPDPFGLYTGIVLCEVLNGDGAPHPTNNRQALLDEVARTVNLEPWFGMEQEYTLLKEKRPLGFPEHGFPEPQGVYYCSAGADRAFGREIADAHLAACLRAGLPITGTNAEVMPGQWEYQIGGPGVGPVVVSDLVWISRWLLLKVAESRGVTATFDPKPMLGDWNGAGMHTNFSTSEMRGQGGLDKIQEFCASLADRTHEHLAVYGDGIELRLTGQHETCSINEFRWGIADRTASVRIPRHVAQEGHGYLEDRRPNANADPYEVCRVLLESCSTSEEESSESD